MATPLALCPSGTGFGRGVIGRRSNGGNVNMTAPPEGWRPEAEMRMYRRTLPMNFEVMSKRMRYHTIVMDMI